MIHYSCKAGQLEKQKTACLILGIFEGKKQPQGTENINSQSHGMIQQLHHQGDIKGHVGDHLMLYQVPGITAKRVLLVGCGKRHDLNPKQYKKIIATMAKALRQHHIQDAVCTLPQLATKSEALFWFVRHTIESIAMTYYDAGMMKTADATIPALTKVQFSLDSRSQYANAQRAIAEGQAVADAMVLCRNLGNKPANICTPSHLAETAEQIAKAHPNCRSEILDEKAIIKEGLSCLHAVGKGSPVPPRLICLHYQGAKKSEQPYVLVGKGITFDSGGISIKGRHNLHHMKLDMCGAAAVISTFQAIASLQLPINLSVVVASAENMPSGGAYKPSDVIKTLSGKTVEVLDTDAEGRLVLSDALTYCKRFNPKIVINAATLTGACIVALGHHLSAVYSNNGNLSQQILQAGKQCDDPGWAMPINEDYQEQLKSDVADFSNLGGAGGGSVTAACFLARFTEDYPWAHLDIAGTAMKDGATGRAVPMLVQYCLNQVK